MRQLLQRAWGVRALGAALPTLRFLRIHNLMKLFRPRVHCVLAITFRCDYFGICEYCPIPSLAKLYPKTTPHQKWIDLFKRFPPCTLEISGGEPFLVEDFKEFVSEIPDGHEVRVTTNLSFNVDEFSDSLGKFDWITASFHPHAVGVKDFLKKTKRVQAINPNLSVCMVAYPPLLPDLEEYIQTFEKNGIPTTIEPYINPHSPYTPEEKKFVKKLITSKRTGGYPHYGILGYPHDDTQPRLCNAGIRHLYLMPNGDAYTCGTGMEWDHDGASDFKRFPKRNKNPKYLMGNVFDENFRLRKEWIRCEIPCYGCDPDYIKRRAIAT